MADAVEPIQEVELQTFPRNILQGAQDECNVNDGKNVPSPEIRDGVASNKDGRPDEDTDQTQTTSDTFSNFYFFLDIFSIATYLVDVGSDIWIAYLYYRDGDSWWFSLTLAFILSPCLLMSAYSVFQCIRDGDSCCQIIFAICVTAIPGGAVILYIWNIIQEVKVRNTKAKCKRQELYEEAISSIVGLASLRLIEAFMEAAPQLVLQLHIICLGYGSTKPVKVAVQWATVGTSLGSLSWAVVAFHKSSRLAKKRRSISYIGLALQFLWRVFVIGARVLSFALFASALPVGVLIVAVIYIVIMDVWLVMQTTNYRLESATCYSFVSYLPLAFIHIFCDIFVKKGHSRLRFLFYYTLVYIENAGMLLSWYFLTRTANLWYLSPAFAVVLGGFLVGVLIQMLYYMKCHPNHRQIKACMPASELSCI